MKRRTWFGWILHWFSDGLDFIIHDGRNAEWATVVIKLGMASSLARPGETLDYSVYTLAKTFGVGDALMAALLVFFAVFHGTALVVNGSFKRSPVWRGICCFAGMLIFGFFAYVTWAANMQAPGLLPHMFFGLVFLELTGCRRAGDDRRCLMQH